MPWALTSPVTVGDLDPNGPYSQVKLVNQAHDSVNGIIALYLEYGNTTGGVWVPGIPVRTQQSAVTIEGADYVALTEGSTALPGELTYQAVKRGLYAYLAAHSIIGPGVLT